MRTSSRVMLFAATVGIVGLAFLISSSNSRGQEGTPSSMSSAVCDDMGAVGTPGPQYGRALFADTSLAPGYTERLSKITFEPGEFIDGSVNASSWTYVECGELELQILSDQATLNEPSGTVTTLTSGTVVLQPGDAFFVETDATTLRLENKTSSIALITTAALVSSTDPSHGCDNLPCRGWP